MASARDVAEYILHSRGAMSAMKLQKLVYYSQAWHLVWCEEPLFDERIEAWANGPVLPSLYEQHRGLFMLSPGAFSEEFHLSDEEQDSVERVLNAYGGKTSQWLSNLTHSEAPWLEAREGLADGERGNHEITPAAMAEYYDSL
jgi:uncharacterized phage-associated protein